MFDAPRYDGPPSAHFDGRRFRNHEPTEHARPHDLVRWLATRASGPWSPVRAEPGPPPPAREEGEALRVTLVNHATVLVQVGGTNILTDPVWAERVSPVTFAGPRRYRPPGLRFDDLPPIDLVLLSHNHYDHLCVETLRRLRAAHDPAIVTGLGNAALLRREGIGVCTELDWWGETRAAGVRVTVVPARHFSGRGLRDRDASLWAGLWVHARGGGVYFAGDTGLGAHFAAIRERLGAPRLALLPIGAFRPRWFMRQVHMSPADAVVAHRTLEARTSVAIHYGTFHLADDGMEEPPRELVVAREEAGILPDAFRILTHGQGERLP